MVRKIKFAKNLYSYKVRCLLGLKRSDIMKVLNDYYRADFNQLDKKDIAVILPHCLISDKCPAKFSKSDGILCTKCTLCGCGKIMELAEQKGYQFYISPSVGFTKRLSQRKNLKGVIGVACDYEIERGIHSEKITLRGVSVNGSGIKTQGIRLPVYDCMHNEVDWDEIVRMM
jgi:hypothetical protein